MPLQANHVSKEGEGEEADEKCIRILQVGERETRHPNHEVDIHTESTPRLGGTTPINLILNPTTQLPPAS